jgi:nucleoside-diphosphate-sugar epimerase
MKIFVTGASGFIGSAIVRELIDAGHQVVGLARSDEAASAVAANGAQVQRGSLDDLDSLRNAAADADGVIHTAFMHDFSEFSRATDVDLHVIETIGEALAGTNKPLVVTSGILMLAFYLPAGTPKTEDIVPGSEVAIPRIASERAALALAQNGVRTSIVRLPPTVHGEGDHGFVPTLINIARARGVSAYPGDGSNHWSAVHRLDAAHLFRLALENAQPGSILHGVAEEGIPVREIAEVIGRRLAVPVTSVPVEEANEHFSFLGTFFSTDGLASGKLTQQRLNWQPAQPGLLADMDHSYYFHQ